MQPHSPPRTVADWQQARDLADQYGDCFYAADPETITQTARRFRTAFAGHYPNTGIAYAYKSNHVPSLCAHIAGLGLMAEVGSDLEWWLARRLGVPMPDIVSNGVSRHRQVLREAILGSAIVNLHTPRDLRIAIDTARESRGRELAIGLRYAIPQADGSPSRFGFGDEAITEAAAVIARTPGLRLAGLHAHLPGHEVETIAARARLLVTAAGRLFSGIPDYIDIGGGFYGGVPPKPSAPTVEDYAAAVGEPLREAYGTGPDTARLIAEPGTSLIATAISYVTEVLDVASPAGRPVATVTGSLLHTSPNTRRTNFPVTVLRHEPADSGTDTFDVAGSTLIQGEYLAFGVAGPVAPGDFLRFDNVGAYSVGGMSPPFLLGVPALLARTGEGSWQVWRPAQTPDEVFGPMLP